MNHSASIVNDVMLIKRSRNNNEIKARILSGRRRNSSESLYGAGLATLPNVDLQYYKLRTGLFVQSKFIQDTDLYILTTYKGKKKKLWCPGKSAFFN